MISEKLKLVLVSTPIGFIGSGKGGGVELTIRSLVKGLLSLGHEVTLIAPEGSYLPLNCSDAEIVHVSGIQQPSWQHQKDSSPIVIPHDGLLPKLWEEALILGKSSDAVLNFGYDWLPIWLTPQVEIGLFHLISMGGVSQVMRKLISQIAQENPNKFAFHTHRQASDYLLRESPVVLGNGFDLQSYEFQVEKEGPLGWAGRIAPEKGLEDAVSVASALRSRLLVWGFVEDNAYANKIEENAPKGIIEWRGFLPTSEFQKQLGTCRAFINTPKWNEAYGNVVVEAMACGVPVISYDRGGPGELVQSGLTGWLVGADDIEGMIIATSRANQIDRNECRKWVESTCSQEGFSSRIVDWIKKGLIN